MSSEQSNENHNGIESSAEAEENNLLARALGRKPDQSPEPPIPRRGLEAIKAATGRRRSPSRVSESKSSHASPAKLRPPEDPNKECHRMYIGKIASLKRMRWTEEEALAAIRAIRTLHQGSEHKSKCPKDCFHSNENLSLRVDLVYKSEILPWNDDHRRLDYIRDYAEGRDEGYVLLMMCQMADHDGHNGQLFRQDDLVKICSMNKAEMVNAIYRLHNRGVITYKRGHKATGSQFWLHKEPIKRKEEEKLQLRKTRKKKQ